MSRGRTFLSARMPEVCGYVSLVWTLIFGEADVSVDAHHRSAIRARIGNDMRIDLLETCSKICNQSQKRISHLLFVSSLVRSKPVTVVVAAEIFQELEHAAREITLSHFLPVFYDVLTRAWVHRPALITLVLPKHGLNKK